MVLEVVWRNPTPPPRSVNRLERFDATDSSICIVVGNGRWDVFEMIAGGQSLSTKWDSCEVHEACL